MTITAVLDLKKAFDAQAAEIDRLRAVLTSLRTDLTVGDVPDATMIDHIDAALNHQQQSSVSNTTRVIDRKEKPSAKAEG